MTMIDWIVEEANKEALITEEVSVASRKKIIRILVYVAVALLVSLGLGLSYLLGQRSTDKQEAVEVITEQSPEPTASPSPSQGSLRTLQYLSPAGQYIFEIALFDVSFDCTPSLYTSEYIILDVKELIDESTFECRGGLGPYFSPQFHGWAGNNKLVTEENEGIIELVNVHTKEREAIDYDEDSLQIAETQYRYQSDALIFLNIDTPDGEVKYDIIRTNGQKTTISFEATGASLFYDNVNQGYVFVVVELGENGDDVSQLYFLDEDTETPRLMLTKRAEVPSRGCNEPSLVSLPGEVILHDLNCYTFDKDGDGLVRVAI